MTLLCADLKPRGVVVNMIPGLPAHILFMCVRYADYLNDADMLKSFMSATIDGIKQVVKVGAVLDCTVLYLLIFNTRFTRCICGTWGMPKLPFADVPKKGMIIISDTPFEVCSRIPAKFPGEVLLC